MNAVVKITPDDTIKLSDIQPDYVRKTGFYAQSGKRIFELCLAILILPICALVIGALAVLVASDGHNPFYIQRRVGRHGRLFSMLKLRSMRPDADQVLSAYLRNCARSAQEWDVMQKLHDDPRVTRFGRFLRRSSLDELPQIFNVLRGDMALIGPRPMLDSQRDLYHGHAYYRMRPGITGLWQVSARNDHGFAVRPIFDLSYEQRLSLRTDLTILWRTVFVVLRGTGC